MLYKIVVFQGPSGSGKTTLQKKLGVPRIITWTTRQPRPTEQNGIDYHFTTQEEFHKMQNSGRMVEVTEYKSNYYGTSIDSINNIGKEAVSVVVDKFGAKQIKSILNDNCLRIGVYASKSDCTSRLLKREQPSEEIRKRLDDYESEVQALFECDIIINNSDINWENADRIIYNLRGLLDK